MMEESKYTLKTTMTIRLKRRYEIGEFQIGVLTIDDTFFCYTIEPIDNKIEPGKYLITTKYKFDHLKYDPIYRAVGKGCNPSIEGTNVYFGHRKKDVTEYNAIQIGKEMIEDKMYDSACTYMQLYEKIKIAKHSGEQINLIVEEA